MRVESPVLRALVIGAVAMGMMATPAIASSEKKPEPGPSAPYHLTGSAARSISEELVTKRIEESDRLEESSFDVCYRRAPMRIDCDISATGETPNAYIDCEFRTLVRAVDRQPVGRFQAKRCEVHVKPLLTYIAAYEAMATVATEAIGLPVGETPGAGRAVLGLLRTSRSSFRGIAVWEPKKSGGLSDFCALGLTAKAGDLVVIELGKRACYA